MNRVEFMNALERLLADISVGEREEALQYYNDYLNDAGVENEEDVINSLGSPEKVAANIKAGLSGGEEGEFTESGYHDFEEEKNTVTQWKNYNESDNKAEEDTPANPVPKQLPETSTVAGPFWMIISSPHAASANGSAAVNAAPSAMCWSAASSMAAPPAAAVWRASTPAAAPRSSWKGKPLACLRC